MAASALQGRSKGFTFFLASITALTSLSIDMSLPAIPAIEQAFRQPNSSGALTLSVFLAGYAITPLVGGPLADRYGRRPVLITSLILFTLSSLACTASPSFGFLLIFRIVQGCASGTSVALPLAIVRDQISGNEARQRISEVTTVNGLMPLLAPIFGAWAMLLGSWRWIFGTQALFAVCVLTAVIFYFHESLPESRRQRLDLLSLGRNYRVLLSSRGFMGFSLMYALIFAAIFAYISESPLLMQDMGISRGWYTALFGLTATGTVLGALCSGRISRWKISLKTMIHVGLLLLVGDCALSACLQAAGLRNAWPWCLPPS